MSYAAHEWYVTYVVRVVNLVKSLETGREGQGAFPWGWLTEPGQDGSAETASMTFAMRLLKNKMLASLHDPLYKDAQFNGNFFSSLNFLKTKIISISH